MGFFDFMKKREAPASRKAKTLHYRGFSAAGVGRLLADFQSQSKSIDEEIRFNLQLLRNRCREAERNNPYIRRYLQTLQTNVIGANGITVQVRGRNPNGDFDTNGNASIENEWYKWGQRGNCTVDGKLSWKDCQNLVIKTLARDGEVLIYRVRDKTLKYGYALQFIEADHLDHEYNGRSSNGNYIRMGVEVNQAGKPVAYHVFSSHPHDLNGVGSERKRLRILAEDMFHIFETERAGQTRGVPRLSNILMRLHMLSGYEEAEIVAARAAASKMAFLTRPEDNSAEYVGDDKEGTNVVSDLQAGSVEILPNGWGVQEFDPQHPVSQFGEFVKSCLRGVASGLGISYVTLANDLEGVNYSSIRQGALEDREHFKDLQKFVIEHFVEPVFNEWLFLAMTKGVIPSAIPNGKPLPFETYEKFKNATIFRPRGWSWIDPESETNALIKAIDNKIGTRQDAVENSGRDVEEVFQQIKSEEELAQSYGINLMPIDKAQGFGKSAQLETQLREAEIKIAAITEGAKVFKGEVEQFRKTGYFNDPVAEVAKGLSKELADRNRAFVSEVKDVVDNMQINVNVAAPNVEVAAPNVTIEPAQVVVEATMPTPEIKLEMPERIKETNIMRDSNGNIVKTVQTEKSL